MQGPARIDTKVALREVALRAAAGRRYYTGPMTRPDHTGALPEYRQADHIEELIDQSIEESFPASDPPAVTPRRVQRPTGSRTADGRDGRPRERIA